MKSGVSKLIIFGLGVAAGTAIGILYAPEEGSSTRDKLSFQLSKYREKLAELLNKLKDVENHLPSSSQAKSEGDRVIQDTRQEAEKLLGHVEALMSQIRDSQK